MLKNSTIGYGWLSIALHWISALAVFGLFWLGWYMVELSYDHPWYHSSPHWHESLGLLFFVLLLLRFVWRQFNSKPEPIAPTPLQMTMAKWAHRILYLLMLLIPVTGYLISTADGHGVLLFNWFELPSITGKVNDLETLSGQFHYWLSVLIIILSVGHVGAALKHHWFDKDNTLKRMLRTEKQ